MPDSKVDVGTVKTKEESNKLQHSAIIKTGDGTAETLYRTEEKQIP